MLPFSCKETNCYECHGVPSEYSGSTTASQVQGKSNNYINNRNIEQGYGCFVLFFFPLKTEKVKWANSRTTFPSDSRAHYLAALKVIDTRAAVT